MNPLEIVKKTPANNCGKCGYPTCLAFAANVVKSGEDPAKCPYLDASQLNLTPAPGKNLEKLAEERDLELINHLKGKIRGLDLRTIASDLGAVFQADDSSLNFSYLGQAVRLSSEEITIAGEIPEDHRDQILLYNYIHYRGDSAATGNWIGLESLPNSISKVRTLATYCESPLADLFSSLSPGQIIELAAWVGGSPLDGTTASSAMIINVLPNLPQQVLFWDEEPEDGFEARVKVLFDANVLDYLDIESLVFSAERMADRIIALAKSGR